MKISIAMATYNGREFLPAQLRSFATQNRLPDELVASDDQSTDGTRELIAEFARTAPFPVRVVNDRRLGFIQNFGRALAECTGDLVFLSDQDDVWFDDKIEKMEALARLRPESLCLMNDALFTDGSLNSTGVTKLQRIRAMQQPETTFVMGCCTAMRREFLRVALPIPETVIAHDMWLLGLSDALGGTYRHPEVLQYYRRHGANLSNVVANSVGLGSGERTGVQILRRMRAVDAMHWEQKLYTALRERIEAEASGLATLVGDHRLSKRSAKIRAHERMLTERLHIRQMARHRRLPAVARLLAQGGYGDSSGLLGALKDLLVSPPPANDQEAGLA